MRHAAFTRAPLRLTAGRIRESRSVRRVELVEPTVTLPELPDALDGLRIAHFSDLHAGELFEPHRLGPVVDRVAELAPDLIAVTGDLIDLHVETLVPVLAALRRLHAPLGVYLVPGNHDYLEDRSRFIAAVRAEAPGLSLLVNERRRLNVAGCTIEIAGVDFPESIDDLAGCVREACSAEPCDFRLLLSHHPDAFDAGRAAGADLTLAGHTHGGQLAVSRSRGRKNSIGFGSLAFQYPGGLYRRGERYLFVTRGVGAWFPLRMNCPAEIARLTLKAGPVDPSASHP